jgi:hypothetical protein
MQRRSFLWIRVTPPRDSLPWSPMAVALAILFEHRYHQLRSVGLVELLHGVGFDRNMQLAKIK